MGDKVCRRGQSRCAETTVKACSVGLQIPLEDFLRACLKRTAWRCRFGVARVSVRQCDVTESV